MKIISKILILFMILNIVNILINTTYAADLSTMMGQASNFVNTGADQAQDLSSGIDEITAQFKPIGQLLTMIGAGVMGAVTTFMGIKYLTSGPEAQAKLKQQLIGVIVSGVVIFGAYGIWNIVVSIAQNFD